MMFEHRVGARRAVAEAGLERVEEGGGKPTTDGQWRNGVIHVVVSGRRPHIAWRPCYWAMAFCSNAAPAHAQRRFNECPASA
jgi:hypothetical protein